MRPIGQGARQGRRIQILAQKPKNKEFSAGIEIGATRIESRNAMRVPQCGWRQFIVHI
jgi:hypothetical protein